MYAHTLHKVIVPASKPLDHTGYFFDPFPIVQTNAYTPWNIHHLALDRMPVLETKDPKKVEWLNPQCALGLSDRERVIRDGSKLVKKDATNVFVNIKESIHAMMMHCSGVQGQRTRVLGLSNPGNGGVYMILLVGGIRLDLASMSVALDTAVVPLSDAMMPILGPAIMMLQKTMPPVQIVAADHEVAAWKRLIPAYVERCRTWKHKPNCEYRSYAQIPLSIEMNENPICTCGQGIGFSSPEWNVHVWQTLLPFATRAAISPIFSVSYIDQVAGAAKDMFSALKKGPSPGSTQPASKAINVCWMCGEPGKPNLSACSQCKKARYCSATCQRQDWKTHKLECKKL